METHYDAASMTLIETAALRSSAAQIERHLVVPAAMGGKRAAESSDDDLRENLAVVGAVHRQAGEKLLCARGGETKTTTRAGARARRGRASGLEQLGSSSVLDGLAPPAPGAPSAHS